MGIFADLIFVSTLGFHILIFSVCGLILIFFHRIVVYLQLIHRVTLVFLMILLTEFFGAFIDGSTDKQLSMRECFCWQLFLPYAGFPWINL